MDFPPFPCADGRKIRHSTEDDGFRDSRGISPGRRLIPWGYGFESVGMRKAQPFTPPPVTPAMIFSDRKMYSRKVGRNTMITAANIAP